MYEYDLSQTQYPLHSYAHDSTKELNDYEETAERLTYDLSIIF